ncbi:zinc finger protein 84-like isoform X2 [Manduca sexta]|uniref:zinc finger protein 84-like isoform X2 n=1 Tax=Manduca sexta TaxID=7130 RepID=UPI00188E05E4|nr:zinc finger protein 84-like isoform X2 [Manduca sexta]
MCDIKGNNTNKYDILCHVCLSSNRKLSVLGEFDGLFRKICNYPLETPNIYLCWECIAMLKKMQIFQAKVVEAQRLLRLHCAEIQCIQTKSLSNLRICPRNQIIDIIYDETLKTELKTYEEEKIKLYGEEKILREYKINVIGEEIDLKHTEIQNIFEDKINVNGQEIDSKHTEIEKILGEGKINANGEEIDLEHTEIKEEVEEYIDSDYCDEDIKQDFLQLIKQETELKNEKKTKSRLYKYVFDIKDGEFVKKFNADYENIKCWWQRDRESDILKKIKFKCMKCLCVWKSKTPFMKHQRKFHSATSGPYFCDICSSRFKTKQSILHHVKKHRVALECIACEFKCSSPDVMKVHLRSHKSAVQCLTCDLTLQDIKTFRMHYKATHASFVCDHCGKRCFSKHTLEKHMSSSKPKVQCPECSNVYSRKVYMMNHYRHVHVKRTNYYCSICDKYFLNNTRYKGHMRSNHEGGTKVKNKLCTVCGKGFTENRILIHHMRTHSGERPYECSHCSSRFAQKYAMQKHEKTIHGGKKS